VGEVEDEEVHGEELGDEEVVVVVALEGALES